MGERRARRNRQVSGYSGQQPLKFSSRKVSAEIILRPFSMLADRAQRERCKHNDYNDLMNFWLQNIVAH
jgi:hypothetical protein